MSNQRNNEKMNLQDRLNSVIKFLKIASVWSSGGFAITYPIYKTYKSIDKIVNPKVLDSEKKYSPEFIYIDDPAYDYNLKVEHVESKRSVGLARIWKSLKYSLAWKLLWLCRHGNKEQKNIALQQLAAFRNNKVWDFVKLAQALDMNTAVLLARTRGADLRFFLPPPIHVRRAALTSELLSFKFRDLIISVQAINPHSCIQHFISKYFANIQEEAMEADTIPSKPDNISERNLCLLCLDAIHHHIKLFNTKDYKEDLSALKLVNMGLLSRLAEIMLRNRNDTELDLAVLKILTVLSVHTNLLIDFFQNGLIGELTRLIKSDDVRLSSSAAVCLANLSGEECYRPGLYLLHPIYRTTTPHTCDTLLVHGLRGGVFVTWRQRDKKCAPPVGIIDTTVPSMDCDPCESQPSTNIRFLDPEFRQVVEDIMEQEEEALLADIDVVLHDIPTEARREPSIANTYTALRKRIALLKEEQDRCNYTYCWPKDWLPKDCSNLRILGVNYWTSLSEWLERCPLQPADIASRAEDMVPTLIDAGVGVKDIPLVWLAHSMGGLIVKQALVETSQSSDPVLKRISNNTKAVLFYSTPHKGSSVATMPRAAAAVLWPSNDVRQLQENSPVLLELNKSFLDFADAYGWETISFAETLPTLVTAFKVPVHFVEADSADLGRGVFYKLPLDHLSICKPATRQSILYTTVLDVLQRASPNDVELKYPNSIIQYFIEIIWATILRHIQELFGSIDEKQSPDSLRWFERILLDAFTDGFTD